MPSALKACALALLLAACNPMYVAGPAPSAIFHQQKDIALFLSGGVHGVAGGAGVALTDYLAVRASGGFRPFSLGENGYGLAGVTGYLSLRRDATRDGPDRNANGFRGALSLDIGGGGGNGNSRTFAWFGGSTTKTNLFSGGYVQGQVQLDAGYEWPIFLLLGTGRVTVFSFKGITNVYLEPSLCFRVGPSFLRFEVQVGGSIPMTGNLDLIGGTQPFIISAGLSGLIESTPKPAAPHSEPENPPPPGPPPPPPPPEPPPPPPLSPPPMPPL